MSSVIKVQNFPLSRHVPPPEAARYWANYLRGSGQSCLVLLWAPYFVYIVLYVTLILTEKWIVLL